MKAINFFKTALAGTVSTLALISAADAANFNIPSGDLEAALNAYATQAGVQIIVSDSAVRGTHSRGAKGELTAAVALSRILEGTGFETKMTPAGVIAVVHRDEVPAMHIGDATPLKVAAASAGVESVVVTSSKIKGDIQTVPIAITALSQEQLTSRQIAGGPDLVKEVPNLTFSKTNFTGYNIEIRGIGTQAISVTTDPAVAVAFNDVPFIRNHFFEQEFYDVNQVEVLRGPQGTLYGRNATAGVVNVISAKPTGQFEAMLSADAGNYNNRRFEGMINLPLVDDRVDLRIAGEWTKRDGYSFNELTSTPIDGRDLWSARATLGWRPSDKFQTYLIWEHFQENDDRLRSSKQLCKTDPGPTEIGGVSLTGNSGLFGTQNYLTQGCLPVSLYSPDAFEVPDGQALPYFIVLSGTGLGNAGVDPYGSVTQSRNLRHVQSSLNPLYKARNDIFELNSDYNIAPDLTFTSQTAFNRDSLWAAEDYNRFNTSPGIFTPNASPNGQVLTSASGVFCDPQLGCSDRLVAEDLSEERAWQFSQELRLASNSTGPFNFSFGGNYLHYETQENYYVFINSITLFMAGDGNGQRLPWVPGVSDNHECLKDGGVGGNGAGFQYNDPNKNLPTLGCAYIDPNPIGSLNNNGHNYFLSQNPYVLNSYATFGEAYLNLTNDLKLTAGLRWTDDSKHFILIPSWIAAAGYGYPAFGVVDQKWNQLTGRFATNWTPKLDFTDQTLIYGSYAHGYKAGGANPPGARLLVDASEQPTHPLTFAPEFIDAFELGTKNTLADGALTLNGDVFFYNYKGYQISQIVDRTSVNLNFNAKVKGAELESSWEPTSGLKFSFAGGYEDTSLANGSRAIDLIDRTAGDPNWMLVKPFVTEASNCILPTYVVVAYVQDGSSLANDICRQAYNENIDPVTGQSYIADPTVSVRGNPLVNYLGFNPQTAPNGGAGIFKDLSGNQLPNAPHFTTSLTAEYTLPIDENWAATFHSDFYWQSQSFARVFNDRPYDKIRGYSNVNLAVILTGANGWQLLGYLKNAFDTTAITGDFLNSDDTGLTTNVFLTDPRLYGIRVTKNF